MKKSKLQKERDAHYLYNKVLKTIVYPMLGKQITYLSDLESVGFKFLKHRFKGVYPSDHIPKLTDLTPYCVLNLDKSNESGSHWIALAKIKDKDKVMVYDSFGRKHSVIIKALQFSGKGRIVSTDNDAEQQIFQTDCGSRSIAWLLFVDNWGVKKAMMI
jgi:hypothetical protein